MKVKLDDGAYMPERAHLTDAGLDLRTPYDAGFVDGVCVIDTGVHIELPRGFYGKIESKSGLNVKHGIVSCGGVIDEGYTGSIMVKLYALDEERGKNFVFRKGDKVAQLIIQPYAVPTLTLVSELEPTERGNNGFGSTGR